MEQIFIEVKGEYCKINIDIRNSTLEQRTEYFNGLSKGQIASILEKIGGFRK